MALAASRPLEKVSRDEEGADSSVLVLAKQISHGTLARFFLLSSKSENIKSRIEPQYIVELAMRIFLLAPMHCGLRTLISAFPHSVCGLCRHLLLRIAAYLRLCSLYNDPNQLCGLGKYMRVPLSA